MSIHRVVGVRVSPSEIVCIRCFRQMDAASLPCHIDAGKDFITPGKTIAEEAVVYCSRCNRVLNPHARDLTDDFIEKLEEGGNV